MVDDSEKKIAPDENAQSNFLLKTASAQLDAYARILINSPSQQRSIDLIDRFNLAVEVNEESEFIADLFIEVKKNLAPETLESMGVQIRTQIGDILIARAPVSMLDELSRSEGIGQVQISHQSKARLDSSLKSIGVDKIHQGIDLPKAYKGDGIIVGVVDSGIDFTHPDFSDNEGSRILHLLEFTEGGGENEWSKSDIDNNPETITQIDGNGDSGHGTHVTGIAAGGGQLNSNLTGIAPEADIIFVKGIRNQESFGGYRDTDVVAASQYIFEKADGLGKPAVINLSIGNHFGPHDGTSLYEQTMSSLVGDGRLIVAAAGNEGNDFIHAGGNTTGGLLTESVVIPFDGEQRVGISTWYEPGVIDAVAVFAYDTQFNFIGQSSSIGVGFSLGPEPIVVEGKTLGYVTIDAITTQDPNNGDGNVIFIIDNNNDSSVNISETIWAIGSQGETGGRMDSWINLGGRFYDQIVGFENETELIGDNEYSVGMPATAEKVISVGSYTTKNTWFDIDGDPISVNPLPTINAIAASSSQGPTRDGRIVPDITAPGLIIFSALSSHLDEGISYSRAIVLEGGGYLAQTGTSQASPHVAGTIALMMEAKPDLSYEEAVDALTQTARVNTFTGDTPNNRVGAGYLDAHAALLRVVDQATDIESISDYLPERVVLADAYPNPFTLSTSIAYSLDSSSPVVIQVYNLVGQQVRELAHGVHAPGSYQVSWDGKDQAGLPLSSGIYFVTLETNDAMQMRKVVLLR